MCYAVDIILQVEETSQYYQYYYQHMGTLLSSTPKVPDDWIWNVSLSGDYCSNETA